MSHLNLRSYQREEAAAAARLPLVDELCRARHHHMLPPCCCATKYQAPGICVLPCSVAPMIRVLVGRNLRRLAGQPETYLGGMYQFQP